MIKSEKSMNGSFKVYMRTYDVIRLIERYVAAKEPHGMEVAVNIS